MSSRTLDAERSLERKLRTHAARQLGPEASNEEIDALTERLYLGPARADAGYETPVQRRQRLRDMTGTIEDLRNLKR